MHPHAARLPAARSFLLYRTTSLHFSVKPLAGFLLPFIPYQASPIETMFAKALLAAFLLHTATQVHAAATFNVSVGDGGLNYVPGFVTAAKGDTIQFSFLGGMHTITYVNPLCPNILADHDQSESTFAAPCTKKEGGFDSGPKPVSADAAEVPTVMLEGMLIDVATLHCADFGLSNFGRSDVHLLRDRQPLQSG